MPQSQMLEATPWASCETNEGVLSLPCNGVFLCRRGFSVSEGGEANGCDNSVRFCSGNVGSQLGLGLVDASIHMRALACLHGRFTGCGHDDLETGRRNRFFFTDRMQLSGSQHSRCACCTQRQELIPVLRAVRAGIRHAC